MRRVISAALIVYAFLFQPLLVSANYYGKGLIYYTENYLRDYSPPNNKYNLPLPFVPTGQLDTAYPDSTGAYTIIKGDRYWHRTNTTAVWTTNPLTSVGIPIADPDAAYFDNSGGYTIIKGNLYWYRPTVSANWVNNTLQSVYYSSANAAAVSVPTVDIDAAYFNSSGAYTVIKGDRYWYRTTSTADWFTNTLQTAYATSANHSTIGVPTSNLDAAYFDSSGGYTVIKGHQYWYRPTPTSNWVTNTLASTFMTSKEPDLVFPGFNLIRGVDCSRYLDLTDREINYFKDLKLDFVIVGFGPAAWYNIARSRPANPASWQDPAYDFSRLDQWIGRLQESGIEVVLQLWGTPIWASNTPSFSQSNCQSNPYIFFEPYNRKPTNLADFASFSEAVVMRYNGQNIANPSKPTEFLKVRTVSLWNEPNLTDFWTGTNSEYVQLNNLAYDRIKSVRPDVEVWGGNFIGSTQSPETYLTATNGQLKFDVFALHAYPRDFNSPPGAVSNQTMYAIGNLNKFLTDLDSRYPQKPPVSLTEIGYRTNWENINFAINSGITIDENTKATYLGQSLNIIDAVNAQSATRNRIIGVANNVFYNPWRWWSTGLVNYYNPATNQVDFSNVTPAYQTFKDWTLLRVYTLQDVKSAIMYYLNPGFSLPQIEDGKTNMLDTVSIISKLP